MQLFPILICIICERHLKSLHAQGIVDLQVCTVQPIGMLSTPYVPTQLSTGPALLQRRTLQDNALHQTNKRKEFDYEHYF